LKGLNTVTLIGNLGKDPETAHVEGNIAVARFTLATTETFKDQNGQLNSKTEWHSIVIWRSLAELAGKYLHKGSLAYLKGKLKTRQFEDKEGKIRHTKETLAEHLITLDKKNE
jgi:single-strand DNA-binding protein